MNFKHIQNISLATTVSAIVLMAAATTCTAQRPVAQQQSPGLAALAVVKPVGSCSQLASADLSTAVGAKTHITAAVDVPDGAPAPYCRVTGYVEPGNKFEVRLPLNTWTQRFVQTGCGGLCGSLNIRVSNDEGCYPATHGELVLASTDMGHSGGDDGQFGEKDYQLRIDFAYRGVHVTTLAAKALIAKFYGQPAKYSYFAGCSDGGREALMEAQRYPDDFNGITAGAAAMNFITQNTFYHGWNAVMNTGADGKPVLTSVDLPIIHKAALEQCDAADGLKDGLISNPLACKVNLSSVQCKAGQTTGCLTPAQVKTALAIYAGAHDAAGNKFVLSGPLPGSELAWAGVYIPQPNNNRTMSPGISAGTIKYLAHDVNPPASYALSDFKFDAQSFADTTKLHALYDSTDPDLAPFQKQGGKLIMWHGLADPHISPLNSISYYTAMGKVMGQAQVDKFARLYLFPGGYHCGGGEGPFNVDLLSPIMAWVEKGQAPNVLLASHTAGGGNAPGGPPSGVPAGLPQGGVPAAAALPPTPRVDRTRPVYPYPVSAKYNGTGSMDDAQNFSAGTPAPVAPALLEWMGAKFYTPHYEQWCEGNGASMTCKTTP